MKTLALLYPGCIEFEIMLACELLKNKFPVDVITPEGHEHVGSNGFTLKPSGSISSVDKTQYKVVLVPGGDPGVPGRNIIGAAYPLNF